MATAKKPKQFTIVSEEKEIFADNNKEKALEKADGLMKKDVSPFFLSDHKAETTNRYYKGRYDKNYNIEKANYIAPMIAEETKASEEEAK